MSEKKKNNSKSPFYKKWWFITLVALILLGIIGGTNNKNNGTNENQNNNQETEQQSIELGNKYILNYNDLDKYGKIITLNADSDMPTEKRLFKIPAGKYKVTTSNPKYSAFWIVKDETVLEEDNDYPEVLQYVGGQYMLTTSDDNLNDHASKEVIVTIASDESILLLDSNDSITLEEILQ